MRPLTYCKPEKTVPTGAPEEAQAASWSVPEFWYRWLVCFVAMCKTVCSEVIDLSKCEGAMKQAQALQVAAVFLVAMSTIAQAQDANT